MKSIINCYRKIEGSVFKVLIFSFIAILFYSCEKGDGYSQASEPTDGAELSSADSSTSIMSSTAATYQDKDRKFIKNAEVSMEVKDVLNSTEKIEIKVAEMRGFVSRSDYKNNIISSGTYVIDDDFSKEVTKFQPLNNMVIRIPQQKLGDFLLYLGEILKSENGFLNYRLITADDVSLQFTDSKLRAERAKTANNKLDNLLDDKGKIVDKANIVEGIQDNLEKSDNAKLTQASLSDKVNFATVTISLSQKITKREVTIPNVDSDKYENSESFVYSFKNALKFGWNIVLEIFFFILHFWSIILLTIVGFILFKLYRRKYKK
ncbi:MAG: DUF4349 domain-containing protein [Flavobacteriaceae bacterium]|jgi:hypothetical protein|nr:DUF4349 domain-containing protein [Flavobacteriaceae bacterium]